MNETLFKLISIYEVILTLGTVERPVRIEIFRSVNGDSIYRARIWVQNTYNLYPTFINTGHNGEDLHNVHSSDQIDMEITSLIAEDPELITGKHFSSEDGFLNYVRSRIAHYQRMVESKEGQ